MDTTYQDSGMLKAYGLVYNLLRNGVPVRWVIRQGKAVEGADFTAAAKDHKTQAVVASHGYRGGPFVIDAADAAKAVSLINAWQTANTTTAVHEATTSFSCDVARYLVVAPKVAMHADGNQNIAVSYLNAAGIPDSNGDPWPNTSPDLLTPAQVAGPTTTNHHDGALFDADGDPLYCQLMSMHWNVTSAQANPEVVAEVRQYLTSPVHFFAECQAVDAFENLIPYGHFLTPNGFVIKSQPSTVDYFNPDITFSQIDGAFATVGGSEPAYALPSGDAYKVGGITMLTGHGYSEGQDDVWMTGYLDGACPPDAERCGSYGKVSYLGGHQYTTNVPISTNPKTQGVRLFLNSLFDSTCASREGQPQLYFTDSAPSSTTSPTLTFSLWYANGGPSVALSATVSDAIPAGSTFVSATNGGTFAGGKVTWSVGNIGVGEGKALSFTVQLGSFGTYQNTAQLAYKVGLNPFTMASNTTSTLYDKDTDGDGVLDSVDICPKSYNPSQDLSSDTASCGTCGNVCSAPNGTAGCTKGVCTVLTCNSGFADCDGQASNGCELGVQAFASDANNCGGCGVVCAFQHAGALCSNGTCALGACANGYADCNGVASDGCEYSAASFATDPSNCGQCGKTCAAGFVCKGGSCVANQCPSGFSDCNGVSGDGCEYNNAGFGSDPNNCGGCNIQCALANAASKCVGGQCVVSACNAGYSDCNGLPGDGCEYDDKGFASDPNDCGACHVACSPAHAIGACQAGTCAIAACAQGYNDCNGAPGDGCEHDQQSFATDPNNCGGCGVVCSLPNAVAACTLGSCSVGSCAPGHVDLDGLPENGCEYACTATSTVDTTCDRIDDDCDGQIDEDYVPVTCGLGACTALSTCRLGEELCTPGTPSVEGPAGSASCSDGIDNDCDGVADGADSDCQSAGCNNDAQCNDGDACTQDSCTNGFCVHAGVVCDAGSPGTSSSSNSTSGAGGATSSTSGATSGTTSSGTTASGSSGATGSGSAGGSTSDAASSTGSTSGSSSTASGSGPSTSGAGGDDGGSAQGSCACRAGAPDAAPVRRLDLMLVVAAAAAIRLARRRDRKLVIGR